MGDHAACGHRYRWYHRSLWDVRAFREADFGPGNCWNNRKGLGMGVLRGRNAFFIDKSYWESKLSHENLYAARDFSSRIHPFAIAGFCRCFEPGYRRISSDSPGRKLAASLGATFVGHNHSPGHRLGSDPLGGVPVLSGR